MKKIFLLAAFCLLAVSMMANPVSRQQAQQKAQRFLSAKGVNRNLIPVEGTPQQMTSNGKELLHVFNVEQNGGFVIVSGDDRTSEVLGYALKGSIDFGNLPCNVRHFMEGYAEQIELISKHGGSVRPFKAAHPTIAPMLTSQWNQGAPYNNECPDFFSFGKSVTGCVATAFAQLLYYHRGKMPTDVTLAEITAYDCNTNWGGLGQIHVEGIPAGSPIDWGNMLDSYTTTSGTEENRLAVANLMKYCGAAVRMNYANSQNGGSSAAEISVAAAARKYFGFRKEATVRFHDNMDDARWDALIYSELAAGRPVMMGGQTENNGGHAFICDGFDAATSGYHINWGWGGYCDGYFLLSNLEPEGQGIGGSVGGYNKDQDMLLYMEPGNGTPEEEQLRLITKTLAITSDLEVNRNYWGQGALGFTFMNANGTTDTHDFKMGLAAYQGNQLVDVLIQGQVNGLALNRISGFSGTCYAGQGWANGTYEIWPVGCEASSSEWLKNDGLAYIKAVVTDSKIVYSLEEKEETPPAQTIVVTVNSVSREYGNENPQFFYTVTGGTLNGLPTITCQATPTSPVGEYDIVASRGSITNENVTFVRGTLTVTKAPLTISAGDYAKMQGEPNPAFAASYSGFKNDENESVLLQKPVITCDATEDSEPGTYPVTVSGAEAENYEISYVNGTLTIMEPSSPAIAFADGKVKELCVAKWDTNHDGELSQKEASRVKDLGDVFTQQDITSFDELLYFTGLTKIGDNAFYDCHNLKSLSIPQNVTAIGDNAFLYCQSLTGINLPQQVTKLGTGAFAYCNSLSGVVLPEALVTLGQQVFRGCTSLAALEIPKNVSTIGHGLVSECPALSELTVNDENKHFDSRENCNAIIDKPTNVLLVGCATSQIPSSVTAIGDYAFAYVSTLEKITIPAHVKTVGAFAFQNCPQLKRVVIELGMESLGEGAFMNCYQLERVTVLRTLPLPISDNVFASDKDGGSSFTTAELLVPTGAKSAYEAAEGWKRFKTITEIATISANNLTREYGEDNPALDFTVAGGGYTGAPVLSCEATKTSPVGTYPITISMGSIDNEYVTLVSGTLTITPAPLTISAGIYTRKQGEENPEFTVTYQGFKNSETAEVLAKAPVVSCEATPTSAPGEYPITVSGAEAENYAITYEPGKLIVLDADAVMVTALSYTRKYGEENPDFEYIVNGTDLVGVPLISCEATTTSPVGTYPILIAKGSVENFNVTFVEGTLTIEPAPLTISAGTYTKKQGEDMPEFTLTYTGFMNDETTEVLITQPLVSCEATRESEPGEYPVTVSGAEAQNYTITYESGTLVVTEADPVTLMARSYTRMYGVENPEFEFDVIGEVTVAGIPEFICEATPASPVGSYPIVISKGGVENFNVTYVNGMLTVEPAPLTIKAGTYTMKQGEALPDFELVYEGFMNEETPEVLTKQPLVTCSATVNSAPGEYDVIVSGAEAWNYVISYVMGKLIITESDAIADVKMSEDNTDWYTVDGRKLDGKPTRKGVYVRYGKKVVIR